MAKASGPALFDLLDQEQVRVPREINPGRTATDGGGQATRKASAPKQVDRSDPGSHERPLVVHAADRRTEAPFGAGGTVGQSEPRPPFVDIDDDRIRLTFTSARAAVVVFTLLITLLAMFEWGRSRGQQAGFAHGFETGRSSYTSQALSDIETARSAPPATEIIDSLLIGTSATGQPATGTNLGRQDGTRPVQWITGHTYIVVQEFQRGREADAKQAREFLASRGIETELIRYESGAMQLITTRGFNRSDPAQRNLADQWLEKVHAAGEAYFASGGQYRLDGYFATLTGDRW